MPRFDVFNRRTDVFGGSFSADSAQVSFPNVLGNTGFGGEVGMLIQAMQMGYQQQITRLFEVGSPAMYYVAGRTIGQGTIQRVVGPRPLQNAFYRKYGDVCQAATNDLRFSAATGCGPSNTLVRSIEGQVSTAPGGRTSFTAYFVVLANLGLNVTAEQMVIGQSLAFMFGSLDLEDENVQGQVIN